MVFESLVRMMYQESTLLGIVPQLSMDIPRGLSIYLLDGPNLLDWEKCCSDMVSLPFRRRQPSILATTNDLSFLSNFGVLITALHPTVASHYR